MKKKIVLTFGIILTGLLSFAQDFEAPKKGAKLFVNASSVEVAQGGETTFDLWLVRTKVPKKAKYQAPKALSPDGAAFTFTADPENPDHFVVSVTANSSLQGSHSVTIMGKRSGVHSVVGTIVTLNVIGSNTVATKDGE